MLSCAETKRWLTFSVQKRGGVVVLLETYEPIPARDNSCCCLATIDKLSLALPTRTMSLSSATNLPFFCDEKYFFFLICFCVVVMDFSHDIFLLLVHFKPPRRSLERPRPQELTPPSLVRTGTCHELRSPGDGYWQLQWIASSTPLLPNSCSPQARHIFSRRCRSLLS